MDDKLQTLTEQPKQVLFTTEDGVEIKSGDKYSVVWLKDFKESKIKMWDSTFDEIAEPLLEDETWSDGAKFFSTKEAAEQYILENKPCLSVNDAMKLIRQLSDTAKGKDNKSYLFQEITKLAKDKIKNTTL